MEYRLEYMPSAKLMADRARRVWLRGYAWSYAYYLGIPLLALILSLTSPEILASRVGNLLTGILLGITATLALQFVYQFSFYSREASAILRRRGFAPVSLCFDENGVEVDSNGITERYSWKNFNSLWQQPDSWLFFYTAQSFVSVPTQALTDEIKQFILFKMGEVNARLIR